MNNFRRAFERCFGVAPSEYRGDSLLYPRRIEGIVRRPEERSGGHLYFLSVLLHESGDFPVISRKPLSISFFTAQSR